MQRTKRIRGGPAPTKQAGKTARNKRRRQRRKQEANQIIQNGFAGGGVHLSDCAEAYLRALSLPFDEFLEPPCIPDTITIPSHKFCVKARGSFVIGANGIGWVALNPWQLVWNNGSFFGTASTFGVKYTTAAYVNGLYQWAVAAGIPTLGVSGANGNSPFAANQFTGNDISNFRLVGAGIRVQYSGTELNRGGRLLMYRQRTNTNIQNPVQPSTLLMDNSCHFSAVDRRWREVTYLPSQPSHMAYVSGDLYNPATSVGTDPTVLLALVEGAVAGMSFTWECVAHFEVIGKNVNVTVSHSDPVGYGAVMTAVPQTIQDAGASMYNTMVEGAKQALLTASSSMFTGIAAATGLVYGRNRLRQRRLTNV